ncbi:hypothetical protein [Lentilactobacillus hilgardii]|uniref:hypothetical protein n=1 Tax=Lentilactobacillus hilgardii TaxID=1588 RepID=UPI00390C9F19
MNFKLGFKKKKFNIKKSVSKADKSDEKMFKYITPQLLGYKRILRDNIIVLEDDTLAALFRIRGQGVYNQSSNQRLALISMTDNFYTIYTDDLKFIFSSNPVDTNSQQAYWLRQASYYEKKSLVTENTSKRSKYQFYKRLCEEKANILHNIGQKRRNQDYTLMIFGKDETDLTRNMNTLDNYGKYVLDTVPLNENEVAEKLEKLNNMNLIF